MLRMLYRLLAQPWNQIPRVLLRAACAAATVASMSTKLGMCAEPKIAGQQAPQMSPEQYKAASEQGAHMLKQGQNIEAQQLFQKLLQTPYSKKDAMLYCRLSDSYLVDDYSSAWGKRLSLAEKALNTSLAINPEFGCAYRNLAGLAIQREQYPLAVKWATKALTCKDPDPSALWHRARAYYFINRADLALADINQFINLKPPKPDAAIMFKAQVLEKLGRFDEAVGVYRHIATRGKDWASFQVVRCLTAAHKIDDAIAECSKMITINPRNDDALRVRAKLFIEKK
jgi:tetratricopeptide (TPR) repeat protein